MKKGMRKKLFLVALITSIVLQPLVVFASSTDNPPSQKVNYSIGANATASDVEGDKTAAKAIDGIVNRDATNPNQSRWATNQAVGAQTLTIDLKSQKTFDEFIIEWERLNIKGFKIEVSNDNTTFTEVYKKADSTNIVSLTSKIKLTQTVTSQYVRLTVDNYDDTGAQGWKSVSVYEFMIIGVGKNLASESGVGVSADGNETASFAASNVNDSLLSTRWASPKNHNQHWLMLNFGSVKNLRGAVIEWERLNANGYKIQVSRDNVTWNDVKSFSSASTEYRQKINFGSEVQAQYLRVLITSFVDQGTDRSGKSVSWATISILEFEAYEDVLDLSSEVTLDSVTNDLEVPAEINGIGKLTLPTVPEGYVVEFLGADYEQIIDKSGNVTQPLVDTNVQVNYKVSKGNQSKETKIFSIKVKGKSSIDVADNQKPVVVPELAEWKGSPKVDGNFTITNQSKIVINPIHKNELNYMAKEFQKDYKDIVGKDISIVEGTTPATGDFYFTLGSHDTALGDEGYIMEVSGSLKVEAVDKVGAYWATRSILQILKQNTDSIPKGVCRDYPKYKVRGFMLDVARKPFSKSIVDDVIKQMSWYKMNDFQLHLNDNYIFLEEYASDEEAMTAYSGFRLESNIKAGDGKNQADLTSSDMYYTKAEFKKMIDDNAKIGVNIIPEFDSPGHALPFTKVRPDLRLKNVETGQAKRRNEQLDLSSAHYDESIGFIKSIWDEYIDDGTFAGTDIVNIGTDEYYGSKESFRKYSDDMIKYVESKGKTARMWGSLSYMPGSTPVKSENVQLNVWNTGWANPKDMYNKGYSLINMVDNSLYIVPGANYYNDYLNAQNLYQNWQPNVMNGTTIPAGSDQMLGASFAIWNDFVDKKSNGLTELDIYDRFKAGVPSLASKLWGDGADLSYGDLNNVSKTLDDAPNSNPYLKQTSVDNKYLEYNFDENQTQVDSSQNSRDIKEVKNTKNDNESLKLSGGESYAETPLNKVSVGNTLSFDIKLNSPAKPGNILFESDAEYYTHDIRIMKDGTLGFTRELYDYTFNYVLPINEIIHLSISTENNKTTLFVNGKPYEAIGEYVDNGVVKKANISSSSLLLPTQRIGSKTNSIKAEIDNVVISTEIQKLKVVDKTNFTVTSDNENSDGLAVYAFDNNPSTMWHSQWSPSKKPLPATVEIDMRKKVNIYGFKYQTRTGSTNGNITKYTLSYQDSSGQWVPLIENGIFSSSTGIKEAMFKPVEAQKLKLVVKEGAGDLASAAEIDFYEGNVDMTSTEYIVNAFIADDSHGEVSVDKKNVVDKEEVTFTAVAKRGYEFKGWYNEVDQLVSDDSVYTTTLMRNTTLTAQFEKLAEVDKTVLDIAINKAKELDETLYTTTSFKGVIAKLAAANTVKADPTAIAREVTEAAQELEMAVKNVVVKATAEEITQIKTLIVGLESLKNNYTQDEFEKTQKVIDSINQLLTKDINEITSKEAKDAISQLIDAKDTLPNKESLNSLKALVAKAKEVINNHAIIDTVRPSRIKALQSALNDAEKLINNNVQDDQSIQIAFNNLTMALNTLDKIVDKKDLQIAIDTANKLKESDYTKESWSFFKKSIENAKSNNHDDASLDEVNNAINVLKTAMERLVKNPSQSIITEDNAPIILLISIASIALCTGVIAIYNKKKIKSSRFPS